jgi:hypothetical protein
MNELLDTELPSWEDDGTSYNAWKTDAEMRSVFQSHEFWNYQCYIWMWLSDKLAK